MEREEVKLMEREELEELIALAFVESMMTMKKTKAKPVENEMKLMKKQTMMKNELRQTSG